MSPGASSSSPPTASTADSMQKLMRPHEEGKARRLCEQPELPVVDDGCEVEYLVDDGREGRADQRPLDLIGSRVEAVADHLGRDRVGVGGTTRPALSGPVDDGVRMHRLSLPRSMKREPVAWASARQPASRYVVAVSSSRIAGPDRIAPAASDARSTTANGSSSPRVNDHASMRRPQVRRQPPWPGAPPPSVAAACAPSP